MSKTTPFTDWQVFPETRVLVEKRVSDNPKFWKNGNSARHDKASRYRYAIRFLCCGETSVMLHRGILNRLRRKLTYCRSCATWRAKGNRMQRPIIDAVPGAVQRLIDKYRDPEDPVPPPPPVKESGADPWPTKRPSRGTVTKLKAWLR